MASSSSLFQPAALFITFREAVEAGVIVSVALAFLKKTGLEQLRGQGTPSFLSPPDHAPSFPLFVLLLPVAPVQVERGSGMSGCHRPAWPPTRAAGERCLQLRRWCPRSAD